MTMQISVIFADPKRPLTLNVELDEGSTLDDAINHSGILDRFPSIDLKRHKTGIFGKFAKLDKPLDPGDRVEIYTPIIKDPKSVNKRPGTESKESQRYNSLCN